MALFIIIIITTILFVGLLFYAFSLFIFIYFFILELRFQAWAANGTESRRRHSVLVELKSISQACSILPIMFQKRNRTQRRYFPLNLPNLHFLSFSLLLFLYALAIFLHLVEAINSNNFDHLNFSSIFASFF